MTMFSEEDKKRFWKDVHLLKRIRPGMLTLCWVRGKGISGYAAFSVNGKQVKAHIYSWILYNGPLPTRGLHLHHLCGNKRCVNPDHLAMLTDAGHSKQHSIIVEIKCPKCGEPFDEKHPIVNAAGNRLCGQCPPPPATCSTPIQAVYLAKVMKLVNVLSASYFARLGPFPTGSINNWITSHQPIPTRYFAKIDELYAQLD